MRAIRLHVLAAGAGCFLCTVPQQPGYLCALFPLLTHPCTLAADYIARRSGLEAIVVSIPQQLDAESSANLRDIEQALLGATVSVPVFFTQESPELQAAVSGQAGGWACHLTAGVTSCSQHLFLCLGMGPSQGRAQACIP